MTAKDLLSQMIDDLGLGKTFLFPSFQFDLEFLKTILLGLVPFLERAVLPLDNKEPLLNALKHT